MAILNIIFGGQKYFQYAGMKILLKKKKEREISQGAGV